MRMKVKHAISYCRVSTENQGASGIGLEGQLHAIRMFADKLDYEIVEQFTDIASGAGERNLTKRPGLQQAIAFAKTSSLPIIVSSLDRLSRHTRTTEQIIGEEGIEVISATEGRMENPVTISSRAARAQYERDMISQRTKQALAEKKRQGVKLGNPNIIDAQQRGATRNKERAENKVVEIADTLEGISGWSTMTAAEVVELLNDRSILSGRGGRWTISSIRRPLAKAKRIIEDREGHKRVQDAARLYSDHPNFGRF